MAKLPDVSELNAPGVLKTGNYKATINEAEVRDTGLMVVFSLDGVYELARKFFTYNHEIGLRQLRGLLDAAGLPPAGVDESELVGKKVGLYLTYTATDEYPVNVRRFFPLDSNVEWQNTGDDDIPF